MNPEEFQEFLVWLRNRVSHHLGRAVPVPHPNAQERAGEHDHRIRAGQAEPFKYVDVEALPDAARRKANAIIAEWRARHGT